MVGVLRHFSDREASEFPWDKTILKQCPAATNVTPQKVPFSLLFIINKLLQQGVSLSFACSLFKLGNEIETSLT